jgi:diguanylate cyclase (GGDEF)-like protein
VILLFEIAVMLNVVSCFALAHDPRYTAVAVFVCVLGSLLTMRLFARVRRSGGMPRIMWLFLAGTIGGSTIWTTHFVAMLGYHTGVPTGFDPSLTFVSMAIAISTATVGIAIASTSDKSALVEAGGAILGLGIALMHYIGMAAYILQGSMSWDMGYVAASLVAAAFFGAVATNRVARPVTRFCKYGGALALILAIAITHYTGMTALTVTLDTGASIPPEVLSAGVMTGGVLVITIMILGLGASTYMIDVDATEAAVQRYRHLSLHDPLTGLPNRAAFNEHVLGLMGRRRDDTARIAVLSFDLDRFKEVNDVHGHSAGDAVLRAIAERMTSVLVEGEFIARVGGDEFIAVTQRYYMRNDAVSLAQRLLSEIGKPVAWDSQMFTVGSSVGVSIYPGDAENMDDLLAQADVAMYRAKSAGSNSIRFYDSSMDQAARERNALAMDMRAGLQAGEFELFYQQQNDTFTSKVVGFEVLLRWRHPTRGMISPVDFIPIAEKTGFIIELGEWVLRQACTEAATWSNPLSIAVNVAPQQLADNHLPAKVLEILMQTGLPAARLELEITESGIIGDQQYALQIIRQLKNLGVRIAMDDYGTGYSSLSTLQSFPFDKIKIDRAFIDGVATNLQSAAIVRSTLILAASLDIPVLAEGVENDAHMTFLRQEGCMQVQGFLFGKPTPRSGIDAIVNMTVDAEPDAVLAETNVVKLVVAA